MKITRERPLFVPINIQLETQEEVDRLINIVAVSSYKETHSFADTLYEALCKENEK